jgi:hypothetical protein
VSLGFYSFIYGIDCDFGSPSSGDDNPGDDIGGRNECSSVDAFCDENRDIEGWNLFEFDHDVDMYCTGIGWGTGWDMAPFAPPLYLGQSGEQLGVSCALTF